MAGRLDQPPFHRAHARLRHPGGDRPVDLAGIAGAERIRQRLGHRPAARQQQHPGCVLVEPVHEAGLLVEPKAQGVGHSVNMTDLLRAALRRQARRLVERDDVIVAVDHRILDQRGIGIGHARLHRPGRVARFRQRRDAHLLARRKAGCRLHPPAIDTDLALAAHLLDPPLRQMRKLAPKPAIQPLIAIALGDGQDLHRAHGTSTARVSSIPATMAASDSATDRPI